VDSYAVDIRGHGTSGTRGDIGYVGQLENDLADFVAVVRKTNPTAPLTLIGHSAGGGFVLRVAGSPIQNLFARSVVLAPYLGYTAPTNQPNSGGWANADLPRIIALTMLRGIGIDCCGALPVLAFAVPPNSQLNLVPTYTDRLRMNFGVHRDFRTDLAAVTKPLTVYSGADDELMVAGKYAEAFSGAPVPVDVKLIDGINHMGIVSAPKAVSAIAEDVATRGLAGS
jgi:alpha-beta hydrolase superfamily lysophospholipase